jgi:tRNA (adenine-N(1)-)-methyltransferase non-catalytic subunit
MSLTESDLLQAGDTVMITGGDLQRMVTLQARSLTKLGRVPHVNLGSLIGQPAGVMYEVDENTRTLVPYTGPTSEDAHEAAVDAETGGTGDNRHLLDSSNSQAMTQDEIEAIKAAEGVRGIVEKLCQSSATFNAKTAFSQQKYIRRKKKKYMVTFTVERVTPDTFCEMWCPTRRNEVIPESDTRWVRLRVDALAQLMSLANIHAGSRVLLVEKTNGFIPAAILSRLGDDGSIFHVLGHNAHATFTNARNIGLTDFRRRWKLLRRASLLDPTAPEHPAEKQNRVPWAGGAQSPEPPAADADAPKDNEDDGMAAPDGVVAPTTPVIEEGSQWISGNEARSLFKESPPDSFVVVDDSPNLDQEVAELLPYVALGGTIAVYSPYLEQLAKVFRALFEDCLCITLRDTFYREYQVLPGRTHPFVHMTNNGGYLLSAVRVAPRRLGKVQPRGNGDLGEDPTKRHRTEADR